MRNIDGSFANASAGPAVLTDFDDTAAVENVAELLLNRFGDPSWHDVRRRFRDHELTLNEYQEIAFRGIVADRATMQDYVKRNAHLRPYFGELWKFCQDQGVPMAVVSQGLDFYIEALLEGNGFTNVPIYAVNTHFSAGGISYEYRYPRPGQERLGNSKGVVVERFREQGHYVVYIGDGMSDFEAADKADLLFAHRTLAEECTRSGIPFRPFEDFQGVLTALQEIGQNEIAIPSGGAQGAVGTDGAANDEEAHL